MSLDTIIRAWCASERHLLNPSANEDALAAVERHLGKSLPPDFHQLYKFSDGAEVLGGNFDYWPLRGRELSLWNSTAQLRAWEHPIPDEVLIFGGDGSDSLFGVWLFPTGSPVFQSPIVEMGEICEPDCFGVAGTSLATFLRGRTAYYLLAEDDRPTDALDALGLPEELRFPVEELEDEHFARLRQWADPQLAERHGDPYKSRYDAAALKNLFSGDQSKEDRE